MFGEGKVAIVTGIGPGMGRSIALGFASRGVDVALAARRKERLDAVADEVRALGREPLVYPLDITDRAGCQGLIAATAEKFGGVDFLIQNGHDEGDWTPAIQADPDRWRRAFEVNFFGALHLAQAAAPAMRERGGGAMVFVNSGGALHAAKVPVGMGSYSASKAALASLTRTLASELADWKIRVNGVYLGAVAGETVEAAARTSGAAEGITPEAWMQRMLAPFAVPVLPTPEQCAGTILYLCSELAAAMNGQNIPVNGGQWLGS